MKKTIIKSILVCIGILFIVVASNYLFLKKKNGVFLSVQDWPELPRHHPQGTFQQLSYKSDGLIVKALRAQPIGDGPFPVVIFNRGGNRDYGKILLPHKIIYRLVEEGYMVFATQYRGIDGGEGREEFGGSDVHDVLNLITVAQQDKYYDKKNMFMVGHSRGGMETYLALKEGAQVKAAVVINGCTNLFNQAIYDPEWEEAVPMQLIPGMPHSKLKEYTKRSVVFWPEKIKVPVLIQHSLNDKIIPIYEAEILQNKLKNLGKECLYLIYEDADHKPSVEMLDDMIWWLGTLVS